LNRLFGMLDSLVGRGRQEADDGECHDRQASDAMGMLTRCSFSAMR